MARVVIDATPLLYTATGIGRATRSLIEAMLALRSDHELVLWGRRLLGSSLRQLGLKTNCHHVRLPRSFESLIKCLGLIPMSCRGDLYHATDFYMPLRTVRPTVTTIHDVIFLAQPEAMVDHIRLARLAPQFARRAARIIAISQHVKNDIVRHMGIAPEKIDVVYWGIDHDFFTPDSDRDALRRRLAIRLGFERPYFLAVSCSCGRKNTPGLLRAYTELLKDRPENDLVVVWDAPPEIRAQCAEGPAASRIHFLGRQTDEELRDLYRGATATLYPSLNEGFGLPILESMSCGTPVITSNVTSMPEIAGGASIEIDPHDEQAITKAMEQFENRDPALAELPDRGRERAATFTWERCARQTLDVYDRCL